ncbi:lineage-specific thermal regulator protein [Clostridium liquoris]|uniref:Lineage-specific thermal regulator protein n=1 Tax=Clostridium liquoris TaxID=1289519 RepID=A0A2T0B1B2_9CLOT|nr:PadR family transcriptional regulator [Clostridium liquoris]PRR77410.1 lineage-specific thermal regulator protein [Clostridium liquoris]
MEFDKEILKGYIDTIVLCVLQNSDMYGYEIAKKIKEKSKKEFEIKEATLYVSLKRLEKKKYLEGYWNDNKGTGGGRRRYYRITEEGKKYFSDKVEEWKLLKSLLNNFMEVVLDEKN